MQDNDELAFSVEGSCARVALACKRSVLLAKVEGYDLLGVVLELVARISLQLRKTIKGIDPACGINMTQQSEKIIAGVLEGSTFARLQLKNDVTPTAVYLPAEDTSLFEPIAIERDDSSITGVAASSSSSLRLVRVLGLHQHWCKLFGQELVFIIFGGKDCTSFVDNLLEATVVAVAHESLRSTWASAAIGFDSVGRGNVLVRRVRLTYRYSPTPLRRGGYTQDSCQNLAQIMDRVGTAEGLSTAFDPVVNCLLDAVLSEDVEDVGVGVAAGNLLTGVRMDGDPEHDRLAATTKSGEVDRVGLRVRQMAELAVRTEAVNLEKTGEKLVSGIAKRMGWLEAEALTLSGVRNLRGLSDRDVFSF
ncbi:hypothetical protein BDW22DRAFT_1417906 [Trametopsis cervina]|nr:hypothetical protein BDW22DRAFT_1417906 [Trametopsis cervina]